MIQWLNTVVSISLNLVFQHLLNNEWTSEHSLVVQADEGQCLTNQCLLCDCICTSDSTSTMFMDLTSLGHIWPWCMLTFIRSECKCQNMWDSYVLVWPTVMWEWFLLDWGWLISLSFSVTVIDTSGHMTVIYAHAWQILQCPETLNSQCLYKEGMKRERLEKV